MTGNGHNFCNRSDILNLKSEQCVNQLGQRYAMIKMLNRVVLSELNVCYRRMTHHSSFSLWNVSSRGDFGVERQPSQCVSVLRTCTESCILDWMEVENTPLDLPISLETDWYCLGQR